MEGLRNRLKSRAALRRALPADKVNPAAVQRFWSRLSEDERLSLLRFEDSDLVQRVDSHMKALCQAEIWQRSTSGCAETTRLSGFAFECPAERDCLGRRMAPTALCAIPEFAEIDDLLQHLKQQLGSDLLAGRPALHRSDWVTIVDSTPNSWQELQLQVLRLVELAVFHAEQDAVEAGGLCNASEQESATSGKKKQNAKKRARKKKSRGVESKSAEEGTLEVPKEEEEVNDEDEVNSHCEEDLQEQAQGDFGDHASEPDRACISESRAAESTQNGDGASSGPVSPWFSWVPSVLKDEWHGMLFRQSWCGPQQEHSGIRAVVKNTFFDIEIDNRRAEHKKASRSCRF